MRLVRGADGRLRPTGGSSEISDIWAEQERIRLAEAIQEDQKKAERRNRPWRQRFTRKTTKAKQAQSQPADASKGMLLTIDVPKFRIPGRLAAVRKKVSKKQAILGGGVGLAALVLIAGGYLVFPKGSGSPRNADATSTKVLDVRSEKPTFQTILPEGKSIDDLGGWSRVSPPDSDPAFAYVDKIASVQINVTQQPLPPSLKQDTAGKIEELAKSFTANEKITAGEIVAYIGTSIKGPQSVVLTKNGLLILIKSVGTVSNQDWIDYIGKLQ